MSLKGKQMIEKLRPIADWWLPVDHLRKRTFSVGPVVALAYTATIDIPQRFKSAKAVGPALGLTPVLDESGENRRIGRIFCCGDGMLRTLLYEAAQVLLTHVTKWS
jgi:transposase